MGWELKNADQDYDMRQSKIIAYSKIPLGNYFEEIMHFQTNKSMIKENQL